MNTIDFLLLSLYFMSTRFVLKTFGVALMALSFALVLAQPAQGQGCSRGQIDRNMAYVFGSFDQEQADLVLAPDELESFSSYRIGRVRGGGNTTESTLHGLEEIWMPHFWRGGFAAEWGDIPTPNIPYRTGQGQQTAEVDPQIPEEIGHVTGNSCMTRQNGELYFRGGVVLDKRYEASVGAVLACEINPFCDNPYDYIGIPLRAQFQSGEGWPVQHYVATNWNAAQQAADRIAEGRASQSDLAAVNTFDFELWGEVSRVEIPDEYVPDGCDSFLGTGLWGDDCPDWRYRRTWSGNIWMLSYSDPRVDTHGWPGGRASRGTGGMIHEFSVTFSSTIYRKDWEFMEELESRVVALCGTPEGCGEPGGAAPDSAKMVENEDGESQQEQLCQTAIRTSDRFEEGDCEIGPDNRYTGDLKLDEAAVEEKLNSDLGLPGVSESGKDATDTGQRADSVLNVPSQFKRRCLEEIREDSIRRANTPGDFESEIPEMCEELIEEREQGGETSSAQAASSTSQAQQARQELARQCQTIIERWQQRAENGELPDDTTWQEMVPGACEPYM